MLLPIEAECPAEEQVHLKHMSGRLVVGVLEVPPGSRVLWLVFLLIDGSIKKIEGSLQVSPEVPSFIKDLDSEVQAVARKAVWEEAAQHEEVFLAHVERGDIQLGGDFRFFNLHLTSLLETVRVTRLWLKIDHLVERLGG